MRIAVLSGKGGTGKTLVSVNLAAAAKASTYIDCDVEEPNGHLFFKPEWVQVEEISVKIPKVNNELCNGCRKCVDFCKFNALAYIKNKLIVFDDVCHSCGGCILVCPEKALTEKAKVIGKVQKGVSGEVAVWTGILNTGEATGIPIIKKLLEENSEVNKQTFIDCPPGSACIVMESIKDADYCILVAEPTLFGVHNLNMVYELVKLFNKPYEGDLELALIPESFRTEILKEELDDNGVLIENAQVELESFALLFEFDGDQRHIRHVLYNCAASRPGIEGKTNEDTREVQTETLTIKATPLSSGLVKAKTGNTTDTTVYNDWYKAVYMPTTTESDEGEGVA